MLLKHAKMILLGLSLLSSISLTACTNQNSHPKQTKINVVSSVNFYKDVAQQVGGNHVQVSSIINSNVDPHDFEPTINDSKKVDQANVVIENGLGYDDWMSKILNSTDVNKMNVINVQKLLHTHNGDNEHLWYNPQTMPKLAKQLADVYAKQDPSHRKQYQNNAQVYQKKWQPINNLISQIKQRSQHKLVAVSEPVFNYSLQAMGYRISDPDFANSVDKGVDPSVHDISKLQTQIKHHQIAFFVNNTQASDPVVSNMVKLAKQNQIPIVNVTETQPQNKTYLQWIEAEYRQVLRIEQTK